MEPEGPPPVAAPHEVDPTLDTGRLAARIAELRAQLHAFAPGDDATARRAKEASDATARSAERTIALERLLAASRAREEELAIQSIRDQHVASDLHATIADLSASAARAEEAETLLHAAGQRADAAERRATSFGEELRDLQRENETLRAHTASLESDLRAAVTEIAATGADRVRADRLARELDAARDAAETERATAVELRLQATGAEARVKVLESRMNALDDRLIQLTALLPTGRTPEGPLLDLRGAEPESETSETAPRTPRSQGPDSSWS
jgi:chromosome segregation ATPase